MSLLPAKTLEVIDDRALIDNTLKKNERDEIFRIFWAWTAAFFLMEPIVSLLVLPGGGANVSLVSLMTDYTYGSVTFLNAVYVFKHLFKRDGYFPRKAADLPLFIAIYAAIQFAFDCIWLAATGKISWNYPLKDLLQRYEKVKKLSHSVHVITYGLVWVNLAYLLYNYMRPLEWISSIIGGAFLMLLLEIGK
jgi:hypothetical protein